MTIQEAIQAAVQHHQAGRLGQAEALYRQVLAQQPNHPDALHLLGVIASQSGRHDVALQLIGQAISIDPNRAEFHSNLGLALMEQRRLDEATAAYRRAIELKSDFAAAHNGLGSALAAGGRADEAIGRFTKAMALQPSLAEAPFNLANTYRQMGKYEEAVAWYVRALTARPGWRQAQNNLCNALCDQGRFDEAAKIYRASLAQRPDDPLAHWNVGLSLLRHGELEQAWPEYEWRRRTPELGLRPVSFTQPMWDGGDLRGQRILLHAEQGLGDTVQFIRYVPQVARRGGRIAVACQPELLALLKTMEGVEEWATPGQAWPQFDVHCPLPSLPAALRTTPATIPAIVPYLSADAEKSEQWALRLPNGVRKIGLSWAGRPTHPHDRERSLQLERLAPLSGSAWFCSLQKGESAAQAKSPPMELTDWTRELNDMSDTAALIDQLDLVITVDTSVAHVAGALGKPVWVLLPFVPDWRWMLHRADSPWYPTMRLFRQPRPGDWQTPIGQIAEELLVASS
jgi:tetratricopeptide (TPR) repeat protein